VAGSSAAASSQLIGGGDVGYDPFTTTVRFVAGSR
jgi:hypothetical protein